MPFSRRNQLARFGWNIVQALLFRLSPRPCHGWRCLLLRVFGAKIGPGTRIYPKVEIWAPWNLECGAVVGIGDGAKVYNQAKIKLGNFVTVSQGVHLCAGTHDFTKAGFPLVTKPIIIGDHAWIAAEAFVHPGVVIGEGTVVGARSVVIRDLPPWKVCAGFPAKPLKDRVMSQDSSSETIQ